MAATGAGGTGLNQAWFRGESRALEARRVEFDAHQRKIEGWLREAAASQDE
jgi:hypothetical protein